MFEAQGAQACKGLEAMRQGRDTDHVESWADRHKIERKKRPTIKWSESQDDFLKEACLTTKSFGEIRDEFNAMFPDAVKTRNAIIGRAQRRGYAEFKPASSSPKVRRRRRVRKAPGEKILRIRGDRQVKVSNKAMVPVVFKEEADLRSDAEPIIRRSGPHTMRKTASQIATARKGHLPCIVEAQPLTSVGIGLTSIDSCKWPTSEDIRCMEVCGAPAEIGAYCARHAKVAYREMPTRHRNAGYSRRGMIDDEQRVRDRDARMIADIVLDDTEAPAMSDEVVGLLAHFVTELDE